MKTHHDSGNPYDIEDLLASFGERLVTMQTLTEFVGMHDGKSERLQIVVRTLSILRDDWERFVAAVRAEIDREDAERAAPAAEVGA